MKNVGEHEIHADALQSRIDACLRIVVAQAGDGERPGNRPFDLTERELAAKCVDCDVRDRARAGLRAHDPRYDCERQDEQAAQRQARPLQRSLHRSGPMIR